MYLTANLIGMNCVTGMSILIKKYLLDDLGGIENFGKYLAEDYFIAQAIQNKGYSTVICSQPALQNAGNGSIEQYHDRISRWIQLRTAMMPFMTLLEPLTECFLLGKQAYHSSQFQGLCSMKNFSREMFEKFSYIWNKKNSPKN